MFCATDSHWWGQNIGKISWHAYHPAKVHRVIFWVRYCHSVRKDSAKLKTRQQNAIVPSPAEHSNSGSKSLFPISHPQIANMGSLSEWDIAILFVTTDSAELTTTLRSSLRQKNILTAEVNRRSPFPIPKSPTNLHVGLFVSQVVLKQKSCTRKSRNGHPHKVHRVTF